MDNTSDCLSDNASSNLVGTAKFGYLRNQVGSNPIGSANNRDSGTKQIHRISLIGKIAVSKTEDL